MDSYRGLSHHFTKWLVLMIIFGIVGCTTNRNVKMQSKTSEKQSKIAKEEKSLPIKAKMDTKKVSRLKVKAKMAENKKWTLQDCLKVALKHNEKIQSVKRKRVMKKGEIIEAWSAYLPTAKFEYYHGYAKETGELDFYSLHGRTLIWDTGKTYSKVKRLRAEKAYYKEAQREMELEIAYQVKKAYYELLFAKYLVSAKKAEHELAKRIAATTQKAVEGGESREVKLLEANADAAHKEQALFEVTNIYLLTKQRLNHYMGRQLDAPFEIAGELKPGLIPIRHNKLIARAMATNPQLKKMDLQLKAAKFKKEEARRLNYPDFYAKAFFEYRETDRDYGYTGGYKRIFQGPSYGVGFEVELPLFQRFGIAAGRKRKAKAEIKSIQESQNNTRREIAYHIQKICTKMEEARRGIYAAQLTMEYHSKILEGVEQGKEQSGHLKAKKGLANARVKLMKYVLAYNVSKAQLDRILGLPEKVD